MGVAKGEIGPYLTGVSYPASKEDLIKHAEAKGAPDEVLEPLRALPDVAYAGVEQVRVAARRQRANLPP